MIEQGNRSEPSSEDPGVPEALPRTLVHLRERLGAERVDRLWIFPPLRRGRRERGVVAVSLFGSLGTRADLGACLPRGGGGSA